MIQAKNKEYYGKIAIISLLLAGLRSILAIELPFIINIIIDILISVGLISGVIWLVKSVKQKSKESATK